MLEHGGHLRRIAVSTGTRMEDWLDLSSGISPHHWPIPEPPPECWHRLPEDEDGLHEAAAHYYGTNHLLPLPGTQSAIQLLPRLRPPCRVAVLGSTYAEHDHCWRQQGHTIHVLDLAALDDRIERYDVVIVVNPSNPTGDYQAPLFLLGWWERLRHRHGWLVIDEAFMDPTPDGSLTSMAGRDGLIVLRSFGKFFGCPGARLGFVAAWPALLRKLNELAGPWAVSGPARWVGQRALSDRHWQNQARDLQKQGSRRLAGLLKHHGLSPFGTPLFQSVLTPEAVPLEHHLLSHLILVRHFNRSALIRFGLPGTAEGWTRLETALAEWQPSHMG